MSAKIIVSKSINLTKDQVHETFKKDSKLRQAYNVELVLLTKLCIHKSSGTFSVSGWNSLTSQKQNYTVFVKRPDIFFSVPHTIDNHVLISLQPRNKSCILVGSISLFPNQNQTPTFLSLKS